MNENMMEYNVPYMQLLCRILITFSSLVPVVIFKLLFAVLINGYNANTFLELKLKCIFHHHKHCRKVHKPAHIWLLMISEGFRLHIF